MARKRAPGLRPRATVDARPDVAKTGAWVYTRAIGAVDPVAVAWFADPSEASADAARRWVETDDLAGAVVVDAATGDALAVYAAVKAGP